MKNMWIDDVEPMSKPSPGSSPLRPSSPFERLRNVEATSQRSQTTVESSRTSRWTGVFVPDPTRAECIYDA